MAQTPEGKVKRRVTDVLKLHKCWYFCPANNGFGKSGIPDIVAIVNGLFVGIEVKADHTRKPTELQKKCGEDIMAHGGTWFLVYDNDTLAELIQFIARAKYR